MPEKRVGGELELKLADAPKGATKVRVYRGRRQGRLQAVKTFTDKAVKLGHTYKYKTVGVNAKGQQGKVLDDGDRQAQQEEAVV